jgi:hypothetical protein
MNFNACLTIQKTYSKLHVQHFGIPEHKMLKTFIKPFSDSAWNNLFRTQMCCTFRKHLMNWEQNWRANSGTICVDFLHIRTKWQNIWRFCAKKSFAFRVVASSKIAREAHAMFFCMQCAFGTPYVMYFVQKCRTTKCRNLKFSTTKYCHL